MGQHNRPAAVNPIMVYRPQMTGAALAFAIAMPIAAIVGLKSAVGTIDGRLPAVDHSVEVVDREGRLLRPYPVADGRWRLETKITDVDPDYLAMLLAFEDQRFHKHHGIDVKAIFRSIGTGLWHRRIVSGGSTLTMQVARLEDGAMTRQLWAKFHQMLRARAIERDNAKNEILGHYLSRAPFGGNLEGVRTASLAYFGKEPRRLSAAEAALLVALPQSPEARRPDAGTAARSRARKARDRVLARALKVGLIDEPQFKRAIAEPIPGGRRPMPVLAAHLADRRIAAHPGRQRHDVTIDAGLQARLEELARLRAPTFGPGVSVAILVVDHRSGAIRASIGSSDYFNRDRQGFVDMTRAVRSPGSTLKPLIYGLAFQDGIAHPESLIEDRPMAFGAYQPTNFDREYLGTVSIRKALQLSLNVPAIQMLETVGPARLMATMRRAGAEPVLAEDTVPNLAIGLGGIGMRLTDLVALQAMIASGGRFVPLHDDRLKDHTMTARARPQVLDPRAAWQVASILAGVQDPNGITPGDIAFKTGTSYGYRDACAVGFDGRHTVGVWIGRADGKPVRTADGGIAGIDAAAPVLNDVFARIGARHRLPPAPPGTLIASASDLPPAMRQVGRSTIAAMSDPDRPQIAFPPDRSRLDYAVDESFPIEVRRGKLPLTILVNGAPIGNDPWRRTMDWQPAGAGQVEILVIDAKGNADRSSVFLK